MAIGIISSEDFDKELSKLNGSIAPKPPEPEPIAIVNEPKPLGRGEGNTEVPAEVRAMIAEAVLSGMRVEEVAQHFGVSVQSVNAYKNGAHSLASYQQPNPVLKDKVKSIKERIRKRATARMMNAFDAITPEKIKDLKPLQASQLAKDMSSIIREMDDNDGGKPANNGVQIIFNSPRLTSEADFEVIDAPA